MLDRHWLSRRWLLKHTKDRYKFCVTIHKKKRKKNLFLILAAHPLDALVRARLVDKRVKKVDNIRWYIWLSKKETRKLDLVTVGTVEEHELWLEGR